MIYLDHSATTKTRNEVMETFIKTSEKFYANPASLHAFGIETEQLLEKAREQVCMLVAESEDQVIFTGSGTEANVLAIQGYARANKQKGNHILLSSIEHPSVIEAGKQLIEEGFNVQFLPVNQDGEILVENLKQSLTPETILVSIMHVNNELGTIQPIREISDIVHQSKRAVLHVDVVQSIGKIQVHLNDLQADMMTISAHKINGLKGVGALVYRGHLTFKPILPGGGQEFGIRSSTVAVPQIVAFAKALRLAIEEQPTQFTKYEKWNEQLRQQLKSDLNVRILSEQDGAPHILTFALKHVKGEVLVNAFQAHHIFISTSSACSSKKQTESHVIQAIHLPDDFRKGVVRMSFGYGLTEEQINEVIQRIPLVLKQVSGGRKHEHI